MAITRREIIRSGLDSAAGLLLAPRRGAGRALAAPAGRATSVIQIWMWGGPSHLDTFDPKPDAGYDYCGPLRQARSPPTWTASASANCCRAGQAGRQVLAHPQHDARPERPRDGRVHRADRAHAGDRLVYPGVGAVVSLFKGYDAGYNGLIPPYIVLTEPQGRFSEAGLPRRALQAVRHRRRSPSRPLRRGRHHRPGRLRRAPAATAASCSREPRHARHGAEGRSAVRRCRQAEKQAYDLILGDAGKVFDLVAGEGRAARSATAATRSASRAWRRGG